MSQHTAYLSDDAGFSILAVDHHGAKPLDSTDVENGSYRNILAAQPATVPVAPRALPRPGNGAAPLAGGLTETGPAGRAAGKTGNAPNNDQSGTRVRVAEWLPGANWGGHFLPRIGTEVLVDFLDGDIDRPIIVGQSYNGADLPPFSAGTSPGPIIQG